MRRINVLLLTSKSTNPRPFGALLDDKAIHYLGALGIQETLRGQPRSLDPDVILLYEASSKPNYNWLLPRIKALYSSARILVLGEKRRDDVVTKVISLGGDGYMVCPVLRQHLVCAVKDCERGVIWAPRRILSDLVRRLTPTRPMYLPDKALQKMVTAREATVLNLLVGGLTNKDIAAALGLQEITVKVYISRLLHKLHFKNRCALVSSVVAAQSRTMNAKR